MRAHSSPAAARTAFANLLVATPFAVALLFAVAGCAGDRSEGDGDARVSLPAPSLSRPVVRPDWSLPQHDVQSPILVGRSPELAHAERILRDVVERHALDPRNPWAIAHGLLALGMDARLPDGRSARETLFEYAESVDVGGERLARFPVRARPASSDGRNAGEGILVEPHPELMLKVLVERGATPDLPIRVQGRSLPLGDLYRYALARTWVDGDRVGVGHWDAVAWGLQAIATWAPPGLAWTADGDRAMDVDRYVHAALERLRAGTRAARTALAAGDPPPSGTGLDAYTCGGFHLVQGVGQAIARGFGSAADRERFRTEIDVLFTLYPGRLAQLGAALEQLPDQQVVFLSQQLKYTGHFVETVHKLAALGLFVPTEAQEIAMVRSVGDLAATVFVIESGGVPPRLAELRHSSEQLYLDYVGDSAHALRGLELATGAGTAAY